MWRIDLLGGLRVQHADRVITRFPTQKSGILLAYLAYYPQHSHPREALIDQLWPEIDLDAARSSLRNAVYALRQLLERQAGADGQLLLASRSTVSLDTTAFTTDVAELRAALHAAGQAISPTERAAQLSAALELYRGELLPGYTENWILQERRFLAETYLQGLHQVVEALEQDGDLERALSVARQAVSTDPLRDEAHFDLMRLYAAAGQPSAVLRQYQELERLLTQELGEPPSAAARALAEELRQRADEVALRRATESQRRPPPPSAAAGPPSTELPPSETPVQRELLSPAGPEAPLQASAFHRSLPLQLTRFIGRSREMAEVQQLLGTSRLLTLTGAGGSGKTRLALEVAAQPVPAAGEGVWLVELAPLSDPELLPQALATVLGLPSETERSLTETLVAHLQPRQLLLLLDNCEHLLSACAQLAETLMRHCPHLRILATSREGLGVPGEQIYPVPSLPLPESRQLLPLAEVQEFEAVTLFVDRAALSQPGFAVTEANAAAVVQICRRLDGLPLAIELAAARLPVMAVEQLAARLDDRFRLLTGGSRTALTRQQTLRATLDWSYELLSEAERALLRGLSVFAGGFTLEAAEAVCGGEGLHSGEVLDRLLGLVEKSLVGYEPQRGEVRYRLLETVRQYAREKLAASGELAAVRTRHRDWYLQLAEQAEAASRRREQKEWLTRLEVEIDNLRAALAWCQEAADADPDSDAAAAGLRLAAALFWLWQWRGYIGEGQQWLEGALARGSRCPPAPRASALFWLAHLVGGAARQQHLELARQEQEKAVLLARSAEGAREIALAVLRLSEMVVLTDDGEAAWHHAAEARERLEAVGDWSGMVRAVNILAKVADRRDDRETTRRLLEELDRLCRETGDYDTLVHVLGRLGHLARDAGDFAHARILHRESLVLRGEIGNLFALAQALEDLAVLAGREQQFERAIRLLGAGEAFCETMGVRTPTAVATEYERTVSESRAALAEAAFDAAWAAGRALSLDQAIDLALETREA